MMAMDAAVGGSSVGKECGPSPDVVCIVVLEPRLMSTVCAISAVSAVKVTGGTWKAAARRIALRRTREPQVALHSQNFTVPLM
jgi:hypothetical protein